MAAAYLDDFRWTAVANQKAVRVAVPRQALNSGAETEDISSKIYVSCLKCLNDILVMCFLHILNIGRYFSSNARFKILTTTFLFQQDFITYTDKDKHFVINFKTKTNFKGRFITSGLLEGDQTIKRESSVIGPGLDTLGFVLDLQTTNQQSESTIQVSLGLLCFGLIIMW